MKIYSTVLLGAVLGTALLAGCASPAMNHSSDSMGMMSKSSSDMAGMCDMHKKMMAMSPQDRKMMMDEHMKGMSPTMRDEEMEKMKKCM
jgi:outer membrane murein-binding lipoprotein Lpp